MYIQHPKGSTLKIYQFLTVKGRRSRIPHRAAHKRESTFRVDQNTELKSTPLLKVINIKHPKRSTSKIHQHSAPKRINLKNSSMYSKKRWESPFRVHQHTELKRTTLLEFINAQHPNGSPPLEFINVQHTKGLRL